MIYRLANIEDIEGILALHKKYQIDTIKEEDKKDGFVTTAFTREEMHKLITEENDSRDFRYMPIRYSHH